MGSGSCLQLLQQHLHTFHRHIRRGNRSKSFRRHACQSRSTGIITVRRHASRTPRCLHRQRQRNNSNTCKGSSTRRVRSQNSWSRSSSSHTSPCKDGIPHRTHRRDNTRSPRRNKEKRRTQRTQSLTRKLASKHNLRLFHVETPKPPIRFVNGNRYHTCLHRQRFSFVESMARDEGRGTDTNDFISTDSWGIYVPGLEGPQY